MSVEIGDGDEFDELDVLRSENEALNETNRVLNNAVQIMQRRLNNINHEIVSASEELAR